jgi:hypothetical protein
LCASVQSRDGFQRKWCLAPGKPETIARRAFHKRKDASMNLHLGIGPLVSLLAGILILIMPRLLNYIVALYLIIIGVIGLVGADKLRL